MGSATGLRLVGVAAALVICALVVWLVSQLERGGLHESHGGYPASPVAHAPNHVEPIEPTRFPAAPEEVQPGLRDVSAVRGGVVTVHGSPVAGASVTVRARSPGASRTDDVMETTVTDESGEYRIGALPLFGGAEDDASRDAIRVEADGFLAAGGPLPRRREHRIVLFRPTILTGVVSRFEDGTPIGGAELRVEEAVGPAVSESDAISAPDGRYRLERVRSPGTVRVAVTVENAPPQTFSVVLIEKPEQQFDLRVRLGLDVRVVVLDALSRSPVAEAVVGTGVQEFARTGATGEAVIHLPGASGRYWIEHDEYAPGCLDLDPARLGLPGPDGLLHVEVLLEPGCRVTGRITDLAGQPLPGFVVQAAEVREESGAMTASPCLLDSNLSRDEAGAFCHLPAPRVWKDVITSGDGSFVLQSLPRDLQYRMTAGPRRSDQRFEFDELTIPPRVAAIDLGVLQVDTESAYLHGVVWKGDEQIRGAQVDLEADGRRFQTITGSGGAFKFRDLPPGCYSLRALFEGLEEVLSVDLSPGVRLLVEVQLLPESERSSVSGTVVDEEGVPICLARVAVLKEGKILAKRFTKDGGRFLLDLSLPAGTSVELAVLGAVPGEPRPARTGDSDLELVVPRERRGYLQLLSNDGSPLAGSVAVEYRSGADEPFAPYPQRAGTGPSFVPALLPQQIGVDGSLVLRHLGGDGTFRLRRPDAGEQDAVLIVARELSPNPDSPTVLRLP